MKSKNVKSLMLKVQSLLVLRTVSQCGKSGAGQLQPPVRPVSAGLRGSEGGSCFPRMAALMLFPWSGFVLAVNTCV